MRVPVCLINYSVLVKQIVHLFVSVNRSRLFDIARQVRIVYRGMFGELRVEGVCERHADGTVV